MCVRAQFLPQDRVVAFAQMKPGELLRESERAMGDAHLSTLHGELITESRALADLQRVRMLAHRTLSRCHVNSARSKLSGESCRTPTIWQPAHMGVVRGWCGTSGIREATPQVAHRAKPVTTLQMGAWEQWR